MFNKYNVTVHVDNVNLTGRVSGQVKNPPINDDGDKLKNLESELASQPSRLERVCDEAARVTERKSREFIGKMDKATREAELKSMGAELVYLRKMDEVVMRCLGIEGAEYMENADILNMLKMKLACTDGMAKYEKQAARMGVNDGTA